MMQFDTRSATQTAGCRMYPHLVTAQVDFSGASDRCDGCGPVVKGTWRIIPVSIPLKTNMSIENHHF